MTTLRAAAVAFAPRFLDTPATLERMLTRIQEAADAGAELIAFPETALSGYPEWVCRTDGARFGDAAQSASYAMYLQAGIEADGPEVARITEAARDLKVYVVAGCIERGRQRGRGSVWAGALKVGPDHGPVIHRKLVPTHEERLVWNRGDAVGLTVDPLRLRGGGTANIGALNCWENWMPQARTALYDQGEEIHVALWPGAPTDTAEISRHTAREGRVFVVAAGGVLRIEDIPDGFPLKEQMVADAAREFADGASAGRSFPEGTLRAGGCRIIAPDGGVVAERTETGEGILYGDLDLSHVHRERQLFDPCGHYSRPDVLRVEVDRTDRR